MSIMNSRSNEVTDFTRPMGPSVGSCEAHMPSTRYPYGFITTKCAETTVRRRSSQPPASFEKLTSQVTYGSEESSVCYLLAARLQTVVL